MEPYSSDSSYESDSSDSELEQIKTTVLPKTKVKPQPVAPITSIPVAQPVTQPKPKRNYVKKVISPEDAAKQKANRIALLAKAREVKAAKKQQQQPPPPQQQPVQPKTKQRKPKQIVNNYYYTNDPKPTPQPTPQPRAVVKQPANNIIFV